MGGFMVKDLCFEIIEACPNECKFCSSNSCIDKKRIIEFKDFKRVIDYFISEGGIEELSLSGGEPFLHPNLAEIVKYIKKAGMEVNIYSSGITEENDQVSSISIDEMLELKKYGLTKIMFNVQSPRSEGYDEITGTHGRFSLVKSSIVNAVNAGIYTEIHFVPMKLNVQDIDSIINFAKENQINKVSFLKLVPHGRAYANKETIQLSSEETVKLRNKLNGIKSENIRIGIPLSLDFESDFCHAASSKLYIKFDGTVYGCEAFKYIQQYDESLKEIQPCNIYEMGLCNIYHNSEYIRATQKFIEKYSTVSSRCESCPVQKFLESLEEF